MYDVVDGLDIQCPYCKKSLVVQCKNERLLKHYNLYNNDVVYDKCLNKPFYCYCGCRCKYNFWVDIWLEVSEGRLTGRILAIDKYKDGGLIL